VQERPVVVGADPLKCPDIGGKYLREVPEIPDPGVLHHLGDVVIDKSIAKSVPIDKETRRDDHYNGENPGQPRVIQ
jgi:hypothetical protein